MAELSNAYVAWRSEWLQTTRAAWRARLATRGAATPPLTPAQVTFEWMRRVQECAYTELAFVLHQTPKFVVTNTAMCEADGTTTTVGLTTWACTKTAHVVKDPDVFVHSATFDAKPTAAQRQHMHRLASRVDNDWIVAPVVALFARLAMEDPARIPVEPGPAADTADVRASAVFETEVDLETAAEQLQCMADNGGGHIGLVEIETPQLPVLQFAGPTQGSAPVYLTMTRHDRMNALRVGARMLDPIHGQDLAGKRRLTLLDVELTVFLVWNWFRAQGFAAEFEQAVDAYAAAFALVVKRTADDTRDIDTLVADIAAAQ